jgi:amino acid adenylation domain-containing protein
LSFAQERLWFLSQLASGPAYNDYIALKLTGPLRLCALQQSFNEIARRHESLRTRFPAQEGRPIQIIAENLCLDLPVVDLRHIQEPEREGSAVELASAEAQRPFDLAAGPLIRVTLFSLRTTEQILVIVIHHVVTDGWSWRILLGEISALYRAFSTGTPSGLPELPTQYADYAVWQRGWLTGERVESLVAYWKEQLAGAPEVMNLPIDRPRSASLKYGGARLEFALPVEVSDSLETLSRRENVTPFMTALSALSILLFKQTNQQSVVVGTPVLGRDRVETRTLIGVFINALALRIDLSDELPFRRLLERVREAATGAFAHQDLPFERLVEALQPARDLSHTPIFQVLFDFQDVPDIQQEIHGIELSPVTISSGTTRFDLVFNVISRNRRIIGSIEYRTDLFDAVAIARMRSHFETVLKGIIANPGGRVRDIPVMTDAEVRQLTMEWNDTARDYPREALIHGLFERQAVLNPDRIAVASSSESLTFDELNERASDLARFLRSAGAGPEHLVAICLDRSCLMVTALLGILKSGAAYLPLDPAYPQDRLALILEDASVSVLITQGDLAGSLPRHYARTICLDSQWDDVRRENCGAARDVASDNPAYVIYTSGSTGKPKGVVVTHRSAVNFLCSMRDELAADRTEAMLAVTSLSFDIAALELYLPLITGARIELTVRDEASDVRLLAERIDQASPTMMQATPATWRMLIENGWEGRKGLKILCGGEALPVSLAVELIERGEKTWNLYGPTETTIWSTSRQLNNHDDVTIGSPIGNTQVYILDRDLQPKPIGSAGEVYIGGEGIARGYLGRGDLTAERFVPQPFGDSGSGRMYRTGDLGKRRADGDIEYLGRIDHQVKIRGYRIELEEVEQVLAEKEEVKQAVVIARDDTRRGKELAAFIVEHEGAESNAEELRRYARSRLPEYMVPGRWVKLDRMPLTPNGKVDRGQLQRMEPGIEESSSSGPRTPIEEMLCGVWKEVLGVDRVGVDDNFFALGGHSLLAVQLISRLRDVFEVTLPLRKIFDCPTAAEMVVAILQGQSDQVEPEEMDRILYELEAAA